MAFFKVTWVIEVDAESPEEAAERARQAQMDPDTLATTFTVECVVECGPNNATIATIKE